jgi:hypothetical protein
LPISLESCLFQGTSHYLERYRLSRTFFGIYPLMTACFDVSNE